MRGKWSDVTIGNHTVEAMPTLHPAYLLRNPAAKQQAWRDLLSLKLKMRRNWVAELRRVATNSRSCRQFRPANPAIRRVMVTLA